MLLVAVGTDNLILTSPDALTWTIVNAADSSGDTLNNIAWNGNFAYVAMGLTQLFSSTDGGVTWFSRALPAGTGFSIATLLGERGVFQDAIWDGTQFVVVGFVTGSPDGQGVVGTSPDGVTWLWGNLSDSVNPVSIAFNGSTYVALDWRAFHSGGAQKSRIYSATSPLGPWTLRFTSATEIEYAWLGSNGSGFLAFSAQNAVASFSADGNSWTENATAVTVNAERAQVIWDIPTSKWIVAGVLANGNFGIATTLNGASFVTSLDTGSAAGVAQSVLRGPGGNLFAWVGATTIGQPYTSVDGGVTWSSLAAPASVAYSDFVWTGSLFASLGTTVSFNSDIYSSPDMITFTSHYDDPIEGVLVLRLFSAVTPPAAVYNNVILLRYMGTSKGFSLLTALPNGRNVLTLREVQAPKGGTGLWPLAGNGQETMMALTDDASSYILFSGSQDGTITATAVTQPLPTPTDLPPELWNSNKKFRSVWIEGEDLANFQVFAATDRQLNPDGTVNTFDWGPFNIINNKVDLGMGTAKRIVLKFVHTAVSAPGVTPLISFIDLNYDIMAEAN